MPRRGRSRISRAALWGLAGAILLVAGCFAPIAALSVGGDATLIGSRSILARLILVAAFGSIALILARRGSALMVTGTVAGLLVLVEFLSFRDELATFPASGLPPGALLLSFTHEWGWALLVTGVGLLIVAGMAARYRAVRPA